MLFPLYTEGRLIKDSLGRRIIFNGCQHPFFNSCKKYWRTEVDPIPFASRMKELDVNFVRIGVHYERWHDSDLNPCYRYLVDSMVKELTSRDIYCMVGCMGHELVGELSTGDTENWIGWLEELARRYKDDIGMCGIYILNEPPYSVLGGRDAWYNLAVKGAQAVKSVSDILTVIHANKPNRGGFYKKFFTEPIPVDDVILTYHYYYWHDRYYADLPFTYEYENGNYVQAKKMLEERLHKLFFRFAEEYDTAIICDEFGFNGGLNPSGKGYGNEPGWPQCQIDYMDILKKYRIPFCQYSYWLKNDTNYGLSTNPDYYELSSVGEIWSRYLKKIPKIEI